MPRAYYLPTYLPTYLLYKQQAGTVIGSGRWNFNLCKVIMSPGKRSIQSPPSATVSNRQRGGGGHKQQQQQRQQHQQLKRIDMSRTKAGMMKRLVETDRDQIHRNARRSALMRTLKLQKIRQSAAKVDKDIDDDDDKGPFGEYFR